MCKAATPPHSSHPDSVPHGLEGLDRLAWLLDRAFKIPGTSLTVGLDAILGLIPVGGDVLTGIVQAGIVLVALYHYKVPRAIAARMVANVLLDTTVGSIPLAGDVFDAFFKANTRNLRLLSQVEEQRRQNLPVATAGSWVFLVALTLGLVGLLVLVLVGFVTLVAWAMHALSGTAPR
jgi:Domain of unknown function (DUF4112)